MEITLTPDIEQALTEQARQQGKTPEQLALEGLRREFVVPTPVEQPVDTQESLADYLAGFIGVLHSNEYKPDGAQLSEATGKTFSDLLVKKRQHGHL